MSSWTRWAASATLVLMAAGLSGCAVYGHHGRVRVGVALPLPAIIPIPIPIPRHEPQPEYPQQPPPPAPPPEQPYGYPSAGGGQGRGAYAEYGSVRSVETSPYRGMVRVGVMLDNRSLRYFDLPGTDLRIGERVRVEGDRIYRG